jgi:hypothetical protein
MKTECTCQQLPGDYCLAERPRYFPRQIITADDLTLEQDYFRNKLRRHNRLLHGWGVVCGALVCPVWKCQDKMLDPWKVTVQPGYILGPCGDEILIECARTIDLRKPNEEKKPSDPCGEPIDPWCADPCAEEEPHAGLVYLAVKYKELRTRPVRVQPLGCGCDEQACEYSRWCDGYEFGLLTSCPVSHLQTVCGDVHDLKTRFEALLDQCNPGCPPCPEEPWVVLAEITLDDAGLITGIDNCACRRLVLSLAPFWWKCTCGIQVIETEPNSPIPSVTRKRSATDATVTVTVKGAVEPLKIYAGPGITVKRPVVTADGPNQRITVPLSVNEDAAIGERPIVLSDANCSTVRFNIKVVEPETVAVVEEPQKTPTKRKRSRTP